VLLIEWLLKFGDDICMNQENGVLYIAFSVLFAWYIARGVHGRCTGWFKLVLV
jgi:hypothetical protein